MESLTDVPAMPNGHDEPSLAVTTTPGSFITSESPETATTECFSHSLASTPTELEQESDDVIPKIEELEEEDMVDIRSVVQSPPSVLPSPPEEEPDVKEEHLEQLVTKRPRGRPRKHPKAPANAAVKPLKGRSKTGCITCRRRKKKCDETKPACQHCVKNNVHCEGYPPKDYWQSGKQKAIKVSRRHSQESPRELPALFGGIEDGLDWKFSDHYHFRVSRVLSLFTEKDNPWTRILWTMAREHRGLMHSLLCLSATHMQATDPKPDLEERQHYHFSKAIANLSGRESTSVATSPASEQAHVVDDSAMAQTLVLCLTGICKGDTNGSHQLHLTAAKQLMLTWQAPDPDFRDFFLECFHYLDVCYSITMAEHVPLLALDEDFLSRSEKQTRTSTFLGVQDGLFTVLSRTRKIRDTIRFRRSTGQRPYVDYSIMGEARTLDSALREWTCPEPVHTPRWLASMLYRQCTWLYLHRTVSPGSPADGLHDAVEHALEYLRDLPNDSLVHSVLLMPLFLLGCSAHSDGHRLEISAALENMPNFRGFGNAARASKVVERVWELMDAGADEAWDWEEVMKSMGWDVLIA